MSPEMMNHRESTEPTSGPSSHQIASIYAPNLQGHVPALDAVRGLAILMVTGYRFHEGPADHSLLGRVLFNLLSFGDRGVDLFFVLSGFLITGILFDAKGDPHYFRNFYIRRALRIFPLYYGVLFLFLVVLPAVVPAAAAMYEQAISRQAWLWFYGTNFQPLWSPTGDLDFKYFNHFWSLAVEEHFYFLWPVIILLCTRRTGMIVCGVVTLLALLCRLALRLEGQPMAAGLVTPCRMDALALGGFVALAARGHKNIAPLKPYAVLALIASSLGIAWLLWRQRAVGPEMGLGSLGTSLLAVFFAGLIVLAVGTPPTSHAGRFWNSRLLAFFGKYSYGMYVFQNLALPWLERYCPVSACVAWTGSTFWGRLLFIALASSVTLLLALLSWHLFEKHFLKLKSTFTASAKKTDEPAAAPAD